jgi:rhodanese-related sulfurtransferase
MKLLSPNTRNYFTLAILSLLPFTGKAQITPALVDFDAYEKLVTEVKEHRKTRLLNAEEFVKLSRQQKVIILDTRSDSMYAAAYVKGAIHLNFSDFTQANLAKIIPSYDYKILIYCNNNFVSKPIIKASTKEPADLTSYFPTKSFKPITLQSKQPTAITYELMKASGKIKASNTGTIPPSNAKPITLALNIPTYINLYGYGYRNIYELSELVNTYGKKIEFEGTAVIH